MEPMPRPRPPHLHKETNRHGTVVFYVRIGQGPRIRIRGAYGSPEFSADYAAAIAGKPAPGRGTVAAGTLSWLWDNYRKSGAWSALSPVTRRQRENIMRSVLKTGGDANLSAVTPAAIQSGIDRRKPFAARHFVDTMRGMFKWAVPLQLVRSDPTAGKAVAKPKTKGFPVWTEAELVQFEEFWPLGTRERIMFGVFCFTGLRRGDAAKLGKQHFSTQTIMVDGHQVEQRVIAIDTEKNGMRVTIPVLPDLEEILAAGPIGELSIIASLDGQPLTKETVGNYFRDACRAAGINKSAHGIRKAAATRAADNGASVAMLEAIFGWEGGKMAALYTKSADRKRLARENMGLLSKAETRTPIPAPGGKVREVA